MGTGLFMPGTGIAFLIGWAITGQFKGFMGLSPWVFLGMGILEVGLIVYAISYSTIKRIKVLNSKNK